MSDGILMIGLVVLSAALTVAGVLVLRRWRLTFRPLRPFAALNTLAGEAIESDRTVHVALGNVGVGQDKTFTALVGVEVLYFLTERAAIGERSPLVTMSDPLGLAVAQDTLRTAFSRADTPERYTGSASVWIPNGPLYGANSLAFGAGAAALAADENASANVMIGRFGAEIAFLTEMGARRGLIQIAGSDLLEGQAVSYVLADLPLLGEEMFVGAAYFMRDSVQRGGLLALDMLRGVMIVFIILGFIMATLGIGR